MIVVSDTSALINLAAVGQLDLLRQLYGNVLIPTAVRAEILSGGPGAPGVLAVTTLPWVETRTATNALLIGALRQQLDAGEAEAIALASETKADLLLLDERHARQVAANLGVKVAGLIGVLLEAKHRRLLPAVKPVLDALIRQAGFWISHTLYNRTLQVAGE